VLQYITATKVTSTSVLFQFGSDENRSVVLSVFLAIRKMIISSMAVMNHRLNSDGAAWEAETYLRKDRIPPTI
jgi:hypothetical protein